MKRLIFKSVITECLYLWNGLDVICFDTGKSKDRILGQIMNGFNDVNFNFIVDNEMKEFKIGSARYLVIDVLTYSPFYKTTLSALSDIESKKNIDIEKYRGEAHDLVADFLAKIGCKGIADLFNNI